MNGVEQEKKEYVLVNVAEELVKKKVKEMMASFDMCKCEKCYFDVCAIVLNKTDSRYYTTEKGKLLNLLDATNYQFKTDLVVAVLKAMKFVKENPKH
jgi:competence protein ComFB